MAVAEVIYFANDLFFNSDEDDEYADEYQERQRHVKPQHFAERIVPILSDKQFKCHFRLSRATYEILLGKIRSIQTISVKRGTPEVKLDKQLLMTIWYLSNLECFRSVADRFGVAKSTGWKVITNMCSIILRLNVRYRIICWPSEQQCEDIIDKFQQRQGFPSVLGAIDGSHIPIRAPLDNHASYINRKNFHSIVLQCICSYNMLFLDCYAGEVGSVHDATVFKRSNIFRRVNGICFPNDSHLLGDAAYPLTKNLMVPYKNNGHLNRYHINYNSKLAKTRTVIERSFAILKGRFRRLKLLESTRLDIAVSIILAACIFHNICILNCDEFRDIINIEAEVLEERRMYIFNENRNNDREGSRKRNNIKDTLHMDN